MIELHPHPHRQPLAAFALACLAIAACTRGKDVSPAASGKQAAGSAAAPSVASRDTSCVVGNGERDALSDTGAYRVARRLPGRQVVECRIHDAWAPTRVDIVADTAGQLITGLHVRLPPVAGRASEIQRLQRSADERPARGRPYFFALDFDGDGYRELVAMTWWGATGNTGYDVWRWDATVGRFAKDTVLSGLSNPSAVPGRPCVTSHSVGGMVGMIHSNSLLCREGGRWVTRSTETQDWNAAARAFIRVTSERRGDSLVVIRTDTVREAP